MKQGNLKDNELFLLQSSSTNKFGVLLFFGATNTPLGDIPIL